MTRPTAMAPDASTSPVEWGPEIRVDGKRPEWLAYGDKIDIPAHSGNKWYSEGTGGLGVSPGGVFWDNVHKFRLPADHSHYRQPTTPERDPALWDRMEALVRDLASRDGACFVGEIKHEAQAIVADLPKPVDPDLIEARKLAASFSDREDVNHADYLSGDLDSGGEVQGFLAAIKRGRELAAPEVPHVG